MFIRLATECIISEKSTFYIELCLVQYSVSSIVSIIFCTLSKKVLYIRPLPPPVLSTLKPLKRLQTKKTPPTTRTKKKRRKAKETTITDSLYLDNTFCSLLGQQVSMLNRPFQSLIFIAFIFIFHIRIDYFHLYWAKHSSQGALLNYWTQKS